MLLGLYLGKMNGQVNGDIYTRLYCRIVYERGEIRNSLNDKCLEIGYYMASRTIIKDLYSLILKDINVMLSK